MDSYDENLRDIEDKEYVDKKISESNSILSKTSDIYKQILSLIDKEL